MPTRVLVRLCLALSAVAAGAAWDREGLAQDARDEGQVVKVFRSEVKAPDTYRVGDRIEVELPIQFGVTYRWDLVSKRSRGSKKLSRFGDSDLERKLRPGERRLLQDRGGGLLGGVDGVQTIPVELVSAGTLELTFRKYDLISKKPGRDVHRLTLNVDN